jgi:hypothetical protein
MSSAFRIVFALAGLSCLPLFPAAVHAHHSGQELAIPSAKCGWIEAENLRDRSNLSEFCAQWIPGEFRIRSVAAARERLWVETPPELAMALRGEVATARLLQKWLEEWRKISGYTTASVALLRNHVEFARVHTTMVGDVVTLR